MLSSGRSSPPEDPIQRRRRSLMRSEIEAYGLRSCRTRHGARLPTRGALNSPAMTSCGGSTSPCFCVDVGWRTPHAAPFARAIELLGVGREDALFVGDHPTCDYEGAREAGLRALILSPHELEPRLERDRIARLSDLLDGEL